MSDVTQRQQIAGFDYPTLVVPTTDASVKGVSFHLGDLNITSEMSMVPDFYAAALDQLASTDGIIELVWRLSDFMHTEATTAGAANTTRAATATTGLGSQGVGGWAGLFQFSVKDISTGTIASNTGRLIDAVANQGDSVKGVCTQSHSANANGAAATAGAAAGYWPVELNVMRGIVTEQGSGSGGGAGAGVFANMPLLPTDATVGPQFSTAEHYLNFVGKEITGARSGAQLFENTKDVLNHLIGESGASGSDVSGVQRKIWEAVNGILTNATEGSPNSNNIATKLVRHMLDPTVVDTSTNVTKMRNRFFGDGTGNSIWKRFGPSGGDCKGVCSGIDFTDGDQDFSHYVDVPLAHGDVLEFNLTLTGASNSGGDRGEAGAGESSKADVGNTANPTNTVDVAGGGTSEETQPSTGTGGAAETVSGAGTDRFGGLLPGNNPIQDVTYRVRIHLEGVDQRPA